MIFLFLILVSFKAQANNASTGFPDCPFNLNVLDIVPHDIEEKLRSLENSVKNDKDKTHCKKIGEDIGNLANLMKARENGCHGQPQRCNELINQLLDSVQEEDKKNCFSSAQSGFQTIIGAAFRVGTIISGADRIALSVSALTSLMNLIRKKSKGPSQSVTSFKKDLDKEMLKAFNACYANHLYQEVNCRKVYSDCLLTSVGGFEDLEKHKLCNFGMSFDVTKDSVTRGETDSVFGNSGVTPRACAFYEDILKKNNLAAEFHVQFEKDDVQKKYKRIDIIKLCLETKHNTKFKQATTGAGSADNEKTDQENPNLFRIETKVMADIYACTSYWANSSKKLNKAFGHKEMLEIKQKCRQGKKAGGDFLIDKWVLYYNDELEKVPQTANSNATTIKGLLPSIMSEAREYHKEQITSEKKLFSSESEIMVHANHCTYGAAISLVENPVVENKRIFYNIQNNVLLDRCKGFYKCSKKVLQESQPELKFPENTAEFQNMPFTQSFEGMFGLQDLETNSKSMIKTSLDNICYGMARHQALDNSKIAERLKSINFDAKNCDEPTNNPKRNIDTEELGLPSSSKQ